VLASGVPATTTPARWGAGAHRPVAEAIAARDPDAARAAMEAHYAFLHDPAYAGLHARPFREASSVRARLRSGAEASAGVRTARASG
jgi:hypothetical protein